MRTPSDNLIRLLSRLQLCSRRDLEQCEPVVRRLAQNLPDFDSVWIDALVQRQVLTAWQADVLQSSNPDQLRIDDYTLLDKVGRNTFIARSQKTDRTVTVRRVTLVDTPNSERTNGQVSLLLQRLDDLRRTTPASICLPAHSALQSGAKTDSEGAARPTATGTGNGAVDELFLASRYVDGWSADDLLIRGGRIPHTAVAEIGRQLLEAVSWLESHQLRHGEIVLRNVRLQAGGSAVLVAPFVARLLNPTLSFSTLQNLRDVETTAPELVGTGATIDSTSELYSLGCVLWQLLTARPVFLSADPVTRLLKGKEHDIADVRSIVPDCPDWMARLIHSFTRRSPQLRPSSCDAARKEWAQHCRTGTSATKTLLKRMPDRSYQQARRSARGSRSTMAQLFPTVAAVFLMVTAFAFYGVSRGLVPVPLQLVRMAGSGDSSATDVNSGNPRDSTGERGVGNAATNGVQDRSPVDAGPELMPLPDAAGVVSLKSAATYRARDLSFAGVIHIETTDVQPAIVLVSENWRIAANQVVISNLQVRPLKVGSTTEAVPTMDCECDVLSLRKCIIETISTNSLASSVRWKASSGSARVVSIKDCVLAGAGYGLWLSQNPERCEFKNVLFAKSGAGVRCDVAESSDASMEFTVNRVTQVGGTGFLDIVRESASSNRLLIQLVCGESVIAPSAAIVRVAGSESFRLTDVHVEFLLPERGNPTIIPPDVHPVVAFDRSLNQLVELSESQVLVESLLIAKPLFQGKSEFANQAESYSEFKLLDYEGPKLSPQMPGVNTTELPQRI